MLDFPSGRKFQKPCRRQRHERLNPRVCLFPVSVRRDFFIALIRADLSESRIQRNLSRKQLQTFPLGRGRGVHSRWAGATPKRRLRMRLVKRARGSGGHNRRLSHCVGRNAALSSSSNTSHRRLVKMRGRMNSLYFAASFLVAETLSTSC